MSSIWLEGFVPIVDLTQDDEDKLFLIHDTFLQLRGSARCHLTVPHW